MAIVRIPSEDLVLRQAGEVGAFLARHGVEYEQ